MLLKFLSSQHYPGYPNLDSFWRNVPDLCFKLLPKEGGMVIYEGFCLELYIRGDEHDIWPSRYHQDPDPLSSQTVEIATQWLKAFMKNHPGCRDRFNPSFLPSRFIDVGVQDQSNNY
jgi:hypothetical protein